MSRRLLALVLLLAAYVAPAWAHTLLGEAVGVADGDTITVLDAERVQHRVRLAGIDAPEKNQPFGTRARQALATAVFRKQVTVEWHKRDRYERLVGKVLVNGRDVGLDMLEAGLAWHYKTYEREQSTQDRAAYAGAETHARQARLGLWVDASPVAPWEFRRGHVSANGGRTEDNND